MSKTFEPLISNNIQWLAKQGSERYGKRQLLHIHHEIEENDLALVFHLAEDLIDTLDRKDNDGLYLRSEPFLGARRAYGPWS